MAGEQEASRASPRTRWAGRLGAALALMGLGFLINRLWAQREAVHSLLSSPAFAVAVGLGAVAYALNALALSVGWHQLIAFHGGALPLRTAHRIQARAQLAKYVPGNVFHYAGRHVLGHRAGLSHGVLARAAVHEAASQLLAASLLATASGGVAGLARAPAWPWAAGGAVALVIALPLLARGPLQAASGGQARGAWKYLLGAHLAHLLFALGAGLLLLALTVVMGGWRGPAVAGSVVFFFSIAWTVGFVTPGAPAGLGVREAMLVTLLGGLFSSGEAVAIAVAFRLLTVLGDTLVFLSSYGYGSSRKGARE